MTQSLILSDDTRTMELIGGPDGIYLVELSLPTVLREDTWAQGADSEGRSRVRSVPQNVTGSGKLRIDRSAGTTAQFSDDIDNIMELFESAHRNKGTLKFDPGADFDAVTYDIESCRISNVALDGPALQRRYCEPEFEFEFKPYGRLAPVTVITGEVITGPIDSFEIPAVGGHVDALGELTLTDTSTQNADHIEIGLEQYGYSSASPSEIVLSDAELTITGFAGANATISGSYSTNTKRATLTTTPVVICAAATQPHYGRKKIRARVYASATDVYVRLNWRVAEGKFTPGPWRKVPAASNFYDIALDVIDIAQVPSGTHSWDGYIEAYTTVPGTTLAVDFLEILPAEVITVARLVALDDTPTAFSARDEFDQSAGVLAGKTAPVGGVWAGAGDAVGFDVATVNPFGTVARRAELSDADVNTGRYALSGVSAFASQAVQAYILHSVSSGSIQTGILARYVDTSNWLKLVIAGKTNPTPLPSWQVVKRVAGTVTTLASGEFDDYATNHFFGLRLVVLSDGNWWAYVARSETGEYELLAYGNDSALATGGALASGKPGLYDANTSGTACTRYVDDFVAWAPTVDHALWSGQSAKLKHDSYQRENSAGTRYGKLPIEGQYLRIPPATRNATKSRLVVKRRRYDGDGGLVDAGLTDAMTADLTITPRVVLLGSP